MKKLLSFLLAFVLLVANNPVAVMAQGIPAELSLPAAKVEPQDTPAEGEDPPDRAGEPEATEPEDITVPRRRQKRKGRYWGLVNRLKGQMTRVPYQNMLLKAHQMLTLKVRSLFTLSMMREGLFLQAIPGWNRK